MTPAPRPKRQARDLDADERQPEPEPAAASETPTQPSGAKARKAKKAKAARGPRPRSPLRDGRFAGRTVARGDTLEVDVKVSETASHHPMRVPVTVVRGTEDGPIVYLTSALHGDEINGIAIVRRLLDGIERRLVRGTLVAVPVANRFGFDARDRYLPDRRDLNRAFPGDARGHLAARVADALFRKVVLPCDAGIDLHTAAVGNTNLCHIRGDADDKAVRPLMNAFGTPVLVHGDGPRGSLRRAATEAGVPTIVFEAGEPARFQRHVVRVGHGGLLRFLRHFGLVENAPPPPAVQLLVRSSTWIRADHGGMLDLEAQPGDLVRKGQPIGALHDPLGKHVDHVKATATGVVLGTCTTPLVFPGTALAHVGHLDKTFAKAERHVLAGGDLGHVGPRTTAAPEGGPA